MNQQGLPIFCYRFRFLPGKYIFWEQGFFAFSCNYVILGKRIRYHRNREIRHEKAAHRDSDLQ